MLDLGQLAVALELELDTACAGGVVEQALVQDFEGVRLGGPVARALCLESNAGRMAVAPLCAQMSKQHETRASVGLPPRTPVSP